MGIDLAIIGARQVVALRGPKDARRGAAMREVDVLRDAAVAIGGGRIVAVGSTSQIEAQLPRGARVTEAHGRCVLPGFVDAHTHAVFGGNRLDEIAMRAEGRSYEEIAAAGGGIRSTVRATTSLSEDQLCDASRRYADWFLTNGTTTIECKSGYALGEREVALLRVIRRLGESTPLGYHATFLGAHALPEDQPDANAYIEELCGKVLPEVAALGLAKWCDAFVEHGYFSHDHARRLGGAAKACGLGLRLHVDQLRKGGGASLAAELGAVTADHLEFASAKGIEDLARAGTFPVLLPASVLCLGKSRYAPARAMIEAGLPVVLASDFNPGTAPAPSLPLAAALAVTQMGMLPEEAVTACTVNAAASMGLAEHVGSIQPGMRADLSIWDAADWREVVCYPGALRPEAVFVEGRQVAGKPVAEMPQ